MKPVVLPSMWAVDQELALAAAAWRAHWYFVNRCWLVWLALEWLWLRRKRANKT